MTAPVTVYTTPICPYCSNAKQLLKSKRIEYKEIGMHDMSSDERMALMKKTNNYRTVPQIFIEYSPFEDEYIGGFEDFEKWMKKKTSKEQSDEVVDDLVDATLLCGDDFLAGISNIFD